MKSSTQWVTIPEERIHTPVSNPVKRSDAKPQTRALAVRHKFFWSVGFVAVILVSFAMLSPQQFGSIIQGNLFDAPGVEAPDLTQALRPINVLPVTPEVTDAAQKEQTPAVSVTESNVVQPETTAVDVQIAPLSTGQPAETDNTLQAELDANKRLIEELKKQVDALQGGQPQVFMPPVIIPFLPTDLRSSAPETAEITANLGQTASGGPYQMNTHKVTLDPRMVLEQNRAAGRYVIRPQTSLYAPSTLAYQADLSRVKGTPDSGPKEVMTVALIMTFVIVLGWKAYKLSRV